VNESDFFERKRLPRGPDSSWDQSDWGSPIAMNPATIEKVSNSVETAKKSLFRPILAVKLAKWGLRLALSDWGSPFPRNCNPIGTLDSNAFMRGTFQTVEKILHHHSGDIIYRLLNPIRI